MLRWRTHSLQAPRVFRELWRASPGITIALAVIAFSLIAMNVLAFLPHHKTKAVVAKSTTTTTEKPTRISNVEYVTRHQGRDSTVSTLRTA